MHGKLKLIFILFVFLLIGSASISAQEKENPITHPPRIQFNLFEDLKIHLDATAKDWAAAKEKYIYLLVYGKTSSNRSAIERKECLNILKKSKFYLTQKHKIPAKKIKTVYTGTLLPDREFTVWIIAQKDALK